jgi:hypothetical protein
MADTSSLFPIVLLVGCSIYYLCVKCGRFLGNWRKLERFVKEELAICFFDHCCFRFDNCLVANCFFLAFVVLALLS